MSGMLVKELLYLKGQKRALYSVLIVAIVFFALMLSQGHNESPAEKNLMLAASMGILMAMLAAIVIINCLASDEKAKWDSYARSLPVGATRIIGAKYLFLLILTAAGMIFGMLIDWVAVGFHVDGNALSLLCAVTGGVSLLMCSLELPLALKFGLQKANLVVILLFSLGPVLLGRLSDRFGVMKISDAQFFAAMRFVPLIALAIMVISYFISCRIYSHKEA